MSEGCSSCSSNPKQADPKPAQYVNLLESAENIIAVASGKGGVGKSTVAVNLAIALAKKGFKVGLLDADIYGPSVAKMFGTKYGEATTTNEKIDPIVVHGVKTLSIGNLVDPDKATIWRGPLIHSALQQMIKDVNWGELDYFIVDLPPGTGDVQLSLVQSLHVKGMLAVTTPQEMSLIDVVKAVDMFEKVGVRVLGVIENMSYFVCDGCNKKHFIFGSDGGKNFAEKSGYELLAQIPVDTAIMTSGEKGEPYAVNDKDDIYSALADKVNGSVAGSLK
mgnify:CR=1 FL=1